MVMQATIKEACGSFCSLSVATSRFLDETYTLNVKIGLAQCKGLV